MRESGHPRADGAARDDQRQKGPGPAAGAGRAARRPETGRGTPPAWAGRPPGRCGPPRRPGSRCPAACREGVLGARPGPVVADDRDPVALDPEDREPVRGEARHGQPRRDPQHLGGGPRLGQRPPRVQQERLAVAPPVAGDRGAHGGGAGQRLGDLLEGADQLVVARPSGGDRPGPGAYGPQHPALLVHDAQPGLGEGALGHREIDDALISIQSTGWNQARAAASGRVAAPRAARPAGPPPRRS